MAGKTLKFFRIATEGATSDGRVIDRAMLLQMAKSYDPNIYGARINLEHIRGVLPDGPFKAYGDVMALKTEEEGGKMGLYAQLDPNDDLRALNKARQKVYCSMEVDTEFADTGKPYLVGLAVTDNPASLGCEMLQFSAKSGTLAARKQKAANLFTEAVEVNLDFTTEADPATQQDGLAEKMRRLFGRQDRSDASNTARHADSSAALELLGGEMKTMAENFTKLLKVTEGMAETIDQLKKDQTKSQDEFATLKGELEKTETYSRRPTATGGTGGGTGKGGSDTPTTVETDC